jgi:signal transduction histidine kinase
VQGLLTLLGAGAYGELSKAAQAKVETAESDITRLVALTNDLLDTERLASGKLEITFAKAKVGETIHEAVESARTFADQHKVSLNVQADNDQVAEFDKQRIVQVLVNLITNAIKYSPQDSAVTITSGCDQKWLTISIIDKGRGVPVEYQESIFEKFQQVTESDAKEKGGKGLGLAICKSIIEQHKGTIGVDSENGSGSTFWIRIPLKQLSGFRHQMNVHR